MTQALLPLAVGIAVGIVVGLLGAGGGILAIPILVYLLHQEPHEAAASSLVIVGLTALVSLVPRARSGSVPWRDALTFGAFAVLGSIAGSRLSFLVPPDVLMALFGVLTGVVALAMFVQARGQYRNERLPDAPAPADRTPSLLGTIAVGLTTGLMTGFFGVGGGFITVPLLVLGLRMPIKRASIVSLVAMVLASAAGLLARAGSDLAVDWFLTVLFTVGSILGGLVGGRLNDRARPATLTLVFAVLLLGVSVFTLVQVLR